MAKIRHRPALNSIFTRILAKSRGIKIFSYFYEIIYYFALKFRASYDENPKSAKGRFWRWHINWCPGWKNFFTHQDEETKAALRVKYNFKKYQ